MNRLGFFGGVVVGAVVIGAAGSLVAKVYPAESVRARRSAAAIPSGPPPAYLCADDDKDAGKLVVSMSDGVLYVCAGEAQGWVPK